VLRQRNAWRRALLATLFLAQGTPQLLAGDEIGNSQQGNNNAYCQDNATSWLDWEHADDSLTALVTALAALRKRYPALRHPRWFEGHPFHEPGHAYTPGGDIAWLRPDGLAMSDQDWDDPWEHSFAYVIEVGEAALPATERVMVLLHPGDSVQAFTLPEGRWRLALATSTAESGDGQMLKERCEIAGPAIMVLVQQIEPRGTGGSS
jgi:pullulanase/glycogen debranching enzyme